MKIKTLFIPPYNAMTHLVEECKQEEQDLDIHIEVGNLQDAVPIAQRAEAKGYDVIVSRGGTAQIIGQHVNIPVVDVHVSGYDMLRVLTMTNDFPGKKAIVGFSNITLGAKAIIDLLDIFIEVYTVEHAEEVEPLVKRLKLEGFELIMGDVITVEAAFKFGLDGILIQSGREAIFEAFQKVKEVYRLSQRKQKEIELLRSIVMMSVTDGLVSTVQGEVIFEQWTNFSNQPIPSEKLIAMPKPSQNQKTTTRIFEEEHGKIKVQVTPLMVQGEPHYFFTFMNINTPNLDTGSLKVESFSQIPMIVQQSDAMVKCLNDIETKRDHQLWTLIGEKGTGKELLARYIHLQKHQANTLFATISSRDALKMDASFDPDIKTIYINDVERLNSEQLLQLTKHLKSLESCHVNFIFSITKESNIDSAILFSDDTARIYLPALRKRKEDIKGLASYYIANFHQHIGTSVIKIKDEAIELLEQYEWPGNVEELNAVIKDAVLAEKGYVLEAESIRKYLDVKNERVGEVDESFLSGTLAEIEKRIIETVMKQENDNQTNVAKRLGINRSTLWRKLKK